MHYHFKSERLGFREWQTSDLEPFAALNADEEVMEFFPKKLTQEQTELFIDISTAHFQAHGFGWYAVDLLETGRFIGFIGFQHVKFDAPFTPAIEIGWRLNKDYWNQGLATEGASACLQHGWEKLDFETVHSFTASVNKRSARVMQKIGMYCESNFMHPKVEKGHVLEEHVLYRIDRP